MASCHHGSTLIGSMPARLEPAQIVGALFGDDNIVRERFGESGDDDLGGAMIGGRDRLIAGLEIYF